MKYLSVDIETTGLDPHVHQIVEIGAVIADTHDSKAEVQEFRCLIIEQDWKLTSYCAHLHNDLWDEMLSVNKEMIRALGLTGYLSYDAQAGRYYATRERAMACFHMWLTSNKMVGKITAAGKNFAGFDKLFLAQMPNNEISFDYRCLDPVGYWVLPMDKKLPDLATCCSRAGVKLTGHHTALADAHTVVKLLWAQYTNG